MTTTVDRLVEDYLDRLEEELAGVPRSRRRELVNEISAHIDEARREARTEAEVLTLLDRLGDPAEIADEVRDRPPERPRRQREVAALLLLLPGSLILSVFGWFAGVVLLWISDAWTVRDKLIGTFVVPGGLGGAVWVAFLGAGVCFDECDGSTSLSDVLIPAYLVAPFVSIAYLAWRLRKHDPLARGSVVPTRQGGL
jgi:HAAS domain-containing protein